MTQNKLKVKKGDQVIVIAGKDKGKKGSILKVIPDANRVVVQGVNIVTKQERASRTSAGGTVKTEGTIHVSNVALVDAKSGKPTRVGYKIQKDGSKVRVAKRSGEVING